LRLKIKIKYDELETYQELIRSILQDHKEKKQIQSNFKMKSKNIFGQKNTKQKDSRDFSSTVIVTTI